MPPGGKSIKRIIKLISKFMKLIVLFLTFFISSLYQEQFYTGKITRVIDGDTFVMQTTAGSIKVRLDGIDCPENKQPYSAESKAFLSKFLNLECKIHKKGTDRYGRILGVLWVEGININLFMVQEGYAWHFKKYSKDNVLAQAEVEAKVKKKGLWQEPNPVAPWDWRKK